MSHCFTAHALMMKTTSETKYKVFSIQHKTVRIRDIVRTTKLYTICKSTTALNYKQNYINIKLYLDYVTSENV